MQCLKNYIQIKTCNPPVYEFGTPSGLYINKDLPLSIESIDMIADSEQGTFLTVWDEVQNRALNKFKIRVKQGYRDLFGQCDISTDWFCEHKEDLAYPLLYFLGSELMSERLYSSRKNIWTTIDLDKAAGLKAEFDQEFILQLKSSLDIINDGEEPEIGGAYYVESIP